MPQLQTKNPVLARALVKDMLDAISARPAAALAVTPNVKLFTAGPTPIQPTSVPGDFTEATFVGYAAAALALPLLGPINIDGDDIAEHNEVDFLAGAVVPPGETILGYWVERTVGGQPAFMMGEIFDTPVPIASAGDFISLDVSVPARLGFALQE